MSYLKKILFFSFLFFSFLGAKTPELSCEKTANKIQNFLQGHAIHKKLTPLLIERTLKNYLDILDPLKTIFLEKEVDIWVNPTESFKKTILNQVEQGNFSTFQEIHTLYEKALLRKKKNTENLDLSDVAPGLKVAFFKKLPWAKEEAELVDRLKKMRSLQIQAISKLSPEMKEKSMKWLQKNDLKEEEKHLNLKGSEKECALLADVLKSFASALDSQTTYFTPEEARSFLIAVQQKLFGIGVQLRDDINGFSVVKIIEDGPAYIQGELKPKDRIIAVDNEPVIGLDINDVVEKIRGKRGSNAVLTVLREQGSKNNKKEVELSISIPRDDVILKEMRLETFTEPFGNSNLLYLHLFSFYQADAESSAKDLEKAITAAKKEKGGLSGVVLDLRYNTGGVLNQAIEVTSLFIKKGVVASIKDSNGKVQHLRNVTGSPVWTGPLIILVNKGSASASEIVAQTLQEYGRALVVGDAHTFGKGTFQTFTLMSDNVEKINPEGEFKVTGGVYYTVSGCTPQLKGVISDIAINGPLCHVDIGEKFSKFPLEADTIDSSLEDQLEDLPILQRQSFKMFYTPTTEKAKNFDSNFLAKLKENTEKRLKNNKSYQFFLKNLDKKENAEEESEEEEEDAEEEENEKSLPNDFQLQETFNILKDFILLKEVCCT